MAREFAKPFYNGKLWKKSRASFISIRKSIDGGICQHCKSRLGYIVDHKIELTPDNINDPNISLNHSNYQYLCTICHNIKTFEKNSAINPGLEFDDDGMLVRKEYPPY